MAQLFPDANSQIAALLQVAQVSKRIVVLREGDKDLVRASRTDRIGGYVNLVKDLVVLEQVCQLLCELIIEGVAMEIDL